MKKNITIIGRGPVGMLAALEFARHNFIVKLIGSQINLQDYRTTALMMQGINFLEKLNLWPILKEKSAPLKRMQIIDATQRLIRCQSATFSSKEINEFAFGYNIPNIFLNSTLDNAIQNNPNISLYCDEVLSYQKNNGEIQINGKKNTYTASCIIAADGKKSLARQFADIKIEEYFYPQSALILNFEHQYPHENTSREFHTESGPCTQVPLPQNQSSLIFVVNPLKADFLSKLDIDSLAKIIEKQLFSILGKIKIISPIQFWPLGSMKASSYAKKNIFLIGETGHSFPPIGAQGLNLSIRDIIDLQETFINYQESNLEEIYNRKRKKDVQIRTFVVDILNQSLLSENLFSQIGRQLTFKILNKIPTLRQLFMREGMSPTQFFK